MEVKDVTAEILIGIRRELDGTNGRLERVEDRLDALQGRAAGIELRLESMGAGLTERLDRIGARLDGHDRLFVAIVQEQRDSNARWHERWDAMSGQLASLVGLVTQLVERDDARVDEIRALRRDVDDLADERE